MDLCREPCHDDAVWQAKAKFCPLCGSSLVDAKVEGRLRPRCSECSFVLYKNPASASAAVVRNEAGEVLLIRRRIPPFLGAWALPAGYQEIDETPQQTALREVYEETGIRAVVTELFDVIFVPDDPRKPANVHVYLCRAVGGTLTPGSDAAQAEWFALDALPADVGFNNETLILRHLRAAPSDS